MCKALTGSNPVTVAENIDFKQQFRFWIEIRDTGENPVLTLFCGDGLTFMTRIPKIRNQ